MTETLCLLGRQPELGITELEALYGSDKLKVVGNTAVLISLPPDKIDFTRLGGTIKLCQVLDHLDTDNWVDIERTVLEKVSQYLPPTLEGKLKVGLSVYGLSITLIKLQGFSFSIKKALRSAGHSIRIIPNQELALSSAQVFHNHLDGQKGLELIIYVSKGKTFLAKTIFVQNISSYAERDRGRPKRDARVGMLPPKLAQMIVNLAQPGEGETVLDPFCGTGVILQEALLMGRYVYGTDIDPRMIDYSRQNLRWLIGPAEQKLVVADATNYQWAEFDTIASETYLGRPFSAEPSAGVLQEVMQDVDTILRKFIKNVAQQTSNGFRMCIAVPAWKIRGGFEHLKMLDSLEDLGYTRLRFVHVSNDQLVYHRPGQIVARELVVLIRN